MGFNSGFKGLSQNLSARFYLSRKQMKKKELSGRAEKFCFYLNRKRKGKIYFNGIKKEICLHHLFSKQHNYFSTKSPNLQNL